MRILHILEATGGGTRRHVLDLLPALQRRGAKCSLLYSPRRNPHFVEDAAILQSKNIETCQVAMGHGFHRGGDAAALREIFAHLKTRRYDIIHCHSSEAGLLGRIANALQKHKAPLVYTPHYIALAAGLPAPQRRAARAMEKILARQTAHFIAVSHHEHSILRRANLLKNNNATVIHNGVDIALFPRASRLAPRAFAIGCFGRLTLQKNQQLLLHALPEIARAIPAASLKFVGDGEDGSTLCALAGKLNCENRVRFCGEVREPQNEYRECAIVAQPSRWEGCSYALLEAMACGKAVVASHRGGNAEVVGEAGVLLPVHSAQIWAQTLIGLLQDPEKSDELGAAARERIASHFRLETMVEKTMQVYQRVLQ
jgi:glycosyltransferase involved in cell wall biosynthesis